MALITERGTLSLPDRPSSSFYFMISFQIVTRVSEFESLSAVRAREIPDAVLGTDVPLRSIMRSICRVPN